MNNEKQKTMKRIGIGTLGIVLGSFLFGMTANAYGPIIQGGGVFSNNYSQAWMVNNTGHTAYCEVFLRQGAGSTPTNTISNNSGVMNGEDPLTTEGYKTMNFAFNTSIVYNNNYPYSGVEVSNTIPIGN